MNLRMVQLILWAAVAALLLPLIYFLWIAPRLASLAPADIGQGDYRLLAHDGRAFTEDSLRGQPSLVFFGFTHCPDVCPTTLGDIALWQDELGDLARDLRVVVITVDPERDTPEVLAGYVGWLDGAIGVTGAPDEVAKALRAFRAFAARVPLEGGDYTMDHSSQILLFDRGGRFAGTISYQSPLPEALGKLRELLAG
ncbi:SCO family protein [Pseudogemmobacter sonorensis]|uniref:SCO family protein n=1 Tax=Pseudogemmobacter sonorensis TaxID=2989681 RepID=UPI003699E3A8